MAVSVCRLTITPVKGTRVREVEEVRVGRDGVRENRRFFVIDDRNRMVNGKNVGELQTVVAGYSDSERRLALTFPGGQVLEDEVVLGEMVQTRFFSSAVPARVVEGPWSSGLSEHTGRTLRLVEPVERPGVDRGSQGAVSLISQGSLHELAKHAQVASVDPRRFRMLVEVDGLDPHEEDRWLDRPARVGEALVRFLGHVGRCLITSRDPDSGRVDLPTLDVLGSYRRELQSTEPLPFGIYGRVVEPGRIRLGDPVALLRG